MGVTGEWTGANTQDMKAAVYMGNTSVPYNGFNATGLNGVEAWVYCPAGQFPGNYPGVQLQVTDCEQSGYPTSSWAGLNQGGWTYVNFPIASWGAVDITNLHMIQVMVQTDGSGALSYPVSGYFLVDNVGLY